MKLEMKVDIVFSTKILILNSGGFREMSRVRTHSNDNTYVANSIFANIHASTKIAPSSKLSILNINQIFTLRRAPLTVRRLELSSS